jgi:hypothetical protein
VINPLEVSDAFTLQRGFNQILSRHLVDFSTKTQNRNLTNAARQAAKAKLTEQLALPYAEQGHIDEDAVIGAVCDARYELIAHLQKIASIGTQDQTNIVWQS